MGVADPLADYTVSLPLLSGSLLGTQVPVELQPTKNRKIQEQPDLEDIIVSMGRASARATRSKMVPSKSRRGSSAARIRFNRPI